MAGEAGKGSVPRPVDPQKFNDNWDKIFGKKQQPQPKEKK